MTVLCCGEPLVMITPRAGHPLVEADECVIAVGGAELNVAIHLARLGVPVRYASAVGADPFGERIRRELASEGVDVTCLRTDPTSPTGLYFKDHEGEFPRMHYYRRGSAASRFDVRGGPDVTEGIEHIHISGISPAASPALAATTRHLVTTTPRPRVSFDVNFRRALWTPNDAAPVLLELARASDIVLVGLDEAHAVWDTTTADDVRQLLHDVPEVVVKDGRRPTHVWLGDEVIVTQPVPVDVLEPVGAGDAFAAAYIAVRQVGGNVATAASRGHELAAHVMSSTSDNGVRDAPPYRRIREVVMAASAGP